MRLCDGCGIKVPRFQPRTNNNGQMLCNGCAEGKPGSPGRPIGLHGSKTADWVSLPGAKVNPNDRFHGPTAAQAKKMAEHAKRLYADAIALLDRDDSDEAFDRATLWQEDAFRIEKDLRTFGFDPETGLRRKGSMDKLANEDMARALENAHAYGVSFGQQYLTAVSPDDHGNATAEAELAAAKSQFEEDKRRFPQLADKLHQAYMEGARDWDNFNRPWQNKGRPDVIQDIGSKTAHDSGDGATIYHCPFCGGGQVVAGSDGSVECGYCHTLFTVQVQPEHAAMPQTIDGVPQDMPGMPGDVGGVPGGGAGAAPGASPATDTGTDAFVPPDAFAPPPAALPAAGAPPAPSVKAAAKGEPEAATKACDNFKPGGTDGDGNRDPNTCSNCFWTIGAHDAKAGGTSPVGKMPSTAYYLNANGVALDEESFLRHLAISFADDPGEVIAQVRAERTAGLQVYGATYSGWKLQDRQGLLAALERDGITPRFAEVDVDHVTHQYPSETPPPPATGQVIGHAVGNGVEALVVAVNGTTERPSGGVYHVTLSLEPGHKAVESNHLLASGNWKRVGPYPLRLSPFVEKTGVKVDA